jgi:arylformamidase
MELIDVSVPIRHGMVVFDGDPEVRTSAHAAMAKGDTANLTRIDFGVHTGTHVDAPLHFIEGGAGVEAVPLDALVGPAVVVDATAVTGHIDAAALARLGIPAGAERVLFRTRNSAAGLWGRDEFATDFTALTEDAAAALVAMGVRLAGLDYLSVAPFGDPVGVHRALLEAGVAIIEGLDLRAVEPGPYQLLCLPILITGHDGAPARVVLGREG